MSAKKVLLFWSDKVGGEMISVLQKNYPQIQLGTIHSDGKLVKVFIRVITSVLFATSGPLLVTLCISNSQ